MSATTYKCPGCGAPLAYDGERGKLLCASCGSEYEVDMLEAMEGASESRIEFDLSCNPYAEGEVQAYICESCGAELLAEETTTATECPYCGSPIVLDANIEEGIRPEKVVPFVVTKEEATAKFESYFKGKKLMPNIFLNTRNRIAEMRRLYVPYWLFDCDAWGDVIYSCEKMRIERMGEWEIRRTAHYLVQRSGGMSFECIPVDGSEKLDNRITESLEPYDYSKAVDFHSAVLSGAMADRADVDAHVCESRAVDRVESTMLNQLRSTVMGYNTVHVHSRRVHTQRGTGMPVLLPVWLITTEKEERGEKKTYTFAINGQTGKLTCDVTADAGKAFLWGAGIFAGVMGVGSLIAYMADMFDSGSMFMIGLAALIAAIMTVAVLMGELKTAAMKSDAASYVRQGSFRLAVRRDQFTHETVQRRRIEQRK